jgi:putative flippase GtrA
MVLRQLIRYALTGVIHNAAGFLLYLLATHFGAEPKIAMSVLFVIGVSVSFLLNRAWAFGDKNPMAGSLARFLIVYMLGYLLNLCILLLFVDRLGYPHQWVQ